MEDQGTAGDEHRSSKSSRRSRIFRPARSLKPDSADYDKANQALMQAAVDYEVWGSASRSKSRTAAEGADAGIFNEITNAVTRGRNGQRVWIWSSPISARRSRTTSIRCNVDQLRWPDQQRNVLFSKPQIDISDEVIAAMNAKYEKGQ